jgi:hypothetical protein
VCHAMLQKEPSPASLVTLWSKIRGMKYIHDPRMSLTLEYEVRGVKEQFWGEYFLLELGQIRGKGSRSLILSVSGYQV